MAGDVKIPVSADVKGVTAEMRQVDKAIDNVGKATQKLGRIKWSPIDVKQIERDLHRIEKLVLDSQKRIAQAAAHAIQPGASPATPSGMPPVPAGNAGRPRGGRGSRTYAPELWDVPQHLIGGVGGGFGQIGGYATRGALSGAARGGGITGGAMGLLRGLGIGALAFGAFKIGQGVSEGHEMSKTRAGTLDSLKRQLGDVGVSFERLKIMSEAVADGMQVNSVEAAELAKEFSRLSRGRGGIAGVQEGTRTALGVARAYGMDAGTSVGFFGGMSNMNPRQNNKELALLIAEAVEKSGGRAKAEDVMQAIQGFAAVTSRMSLSNPNLAAYGGAYAQMTGSGIPGLTGEVAEGVLSQANMSMMRMGSRGEAGRNFTMAAFNRNGMLNPYEAQALAEGGLFGTRRGVFAPDSAIGRYMGYGKNPFAGTAGYDVTNLEAIQSHIKGSGHGKWEQMSMGMGMFGVSTLAQSAALLSVDGKGKLGGLAGLLQKAGIDLKDVNASGIQQLANLDPNASVDTVRSIAKSNREATDWTKMMDEMKKLDDIKIGVGDKLVPLTTDIKGLIADLVGELAPGSAYRKEMLQREKGIGGGGSFGGKGVTGSWGESAASPKLGGSMQSWTKYLSETDRMHGLPSGTSARMIAKESSWNPAAVSRGKDGAILGEGLAQINPTTRAALEKRLGRKFNPFNPDDALFMHRTVMGENMAHFKNPRDAVRAYNGGWNRSNWNNAETMGYDTYVMGTPLPANHAGASGGARDRVQIDVSGEIKGPGGQTFLPNVIKTRVSEPRGAGMGR